jgi:ubiquinone/menaquinone biosynthesis C-methylase UbiE
MALDEIRRVLRKGGIFSMLNISPQHIKNWWVYQYFPDSIPEDKKRFWTVEQISNALRKRGFIVKTEIDILERHLKLAAILEEAQNRDISQLNIISEKQYEQGIRRIEEDLKKNPNAVVDDIGALLSCIARKNTH